MNEIDNPTYLVSAHLKTRLFDQAPTSIKVIWHDPAIQAATKGTGMQVPISEKVRHSADFDTLMRHGAELSLPIFSLALAVLRLPGGRGLISPSGCA